MPPFEKDLKDGDAQCVAHSQVYQFQRNESSDLAVCPGCPITRSSLLFRCLTVAFLFLGKDCKRNLDNISGNCSDNHPLMSDV